MRSHANLDKIPPTAGFLPVAPPKDFRANETPILDIAAFTEAREAMGNRFGKAVAYYIEDTVSYIEAIRKGIAASDAEVIVPAAHTIKSASWQLGAMRLAELALEIESAGRARCEGEGTLAALPGKLGALQAIFEETRKVLEINAR